MRSAFVTLSARTQVKSHDNFKEKSTRGLFRHHTAENALWPKLLGDDNPVNPKNKIPYAKDICGIGHALTMGSAASRHNSCYQLRAQIFQNMHATARSGEAKFSDGTNFIGMNTSRCWRVNGGRSRRSPNMISHTQLTARTIGCVFTMLTAVTSWWRRDSSGRKDPIPTATANIA
jgi:hypothetical protein